MINGLVSLLTPCYNSGKFIHRLLDSVLSQDYPQIEMVAVDDGSTDDTRQKIETYIPKFKEKGYTLKFIHKENGGQASAINMGLPLLQGEFIAWPDSDDYYSSPQSISTFVDTFKKENDKVGIVRTLATFIDELTSEEIKGYQNPLHGGQNFIDLLRGKYPLTPSSYMVRSKALDEAIPGRHIYDGQHPQNIQMFAPISYLYEVRNIASSLVTIVVRHNSDSHAAKNLLQQLEAFDSWIDIYHHTLDNMSMLNLSERAKYKGIVDKVFLNDELALCFHNMDKKAAKSVAHKIKQSRVSMDWRKRIKYILLYISPALLRKIQNAQSNRLH